LSSSLLSSIKPTHLDAALGHQQVRNLWRDYCTTVEAIIFVIDASDEDRFGEVMQELLPLLTDDNLNGTIFVILGNKTDQVVCFHSFFHFFIPKQLISPLFSSSSSSSSSSCQPTLSLDEFVHNLNLTSVLNDAQHLDRAPIKVRHNPSSHFSLALLTPFS
jgi:hypothetical protein